MKRIRPNISLFTRLPHTSTRHIIKPHLSHPISTIPAQPRTINPTSKPTTLLNPSTDSTMRPIRLAFLDCDYTIPSVAAKYGPKYSDVFTHFLRAAESRSPMHPITYTSFDAQKGEFPDPTQIDAILIGGGLAAAYDTTPWILAIQSFIRHTFTHHPHVKLFGICLGHQLIAHSLLGEHGIVAQKNPRGKQFGVRNVQLSAEYATLFPAYGGKVRIQVVHGDHVYVPVGSLPKEWIVMGSTDCCDVHGLCLPGRVMTFQGHFEFTSEISSTSVRWFFEKEMGREKMEEILKLIEGEDDSVVVADMVLAFLTGRVGGKVEGVEVVKDVEVVKPAVVAVAA